MIIEDENVRERFREAAVDGQISCLKCFELADELGVRKDMIAPTLSVMKIKIVHCQLGCFP